MTTSDPGGTAAGTLRELVAEGVSPWLDGVDRVLITSGRFTRLVREIGVLGATSNPAQLAAAVAHAHSAYRGQLAELAERGADVDSAIRALALEDARLACDELLGVFTATDGHDGYVSFDLDPQLADDAAATVAAAAEVRAELDRPNAMVKIPATDQGLVAIRECLAAGICVHVTEVFCLHRYRQVVLAYFEGLAMAKAAGLDLAGIASVASLSVGAFDAEVDGRLAEHGGPAALALRGSAALSNARLLHHEFDQRLGSWQWRGLQALGARPQRLMWTSTETRSGTSYVDRIVAWGTVTAMSPATIDWMARNGDLQGDTLTGEHRAAQSVVDELNGLGITYDSVVRELEQDSGRRLEHSWQELRLATRKGLGAVGRPDP
jgi:transaldolase